MVDVDDTSIPLQLVLPLLYCTRYFVIGRSLEGAFQVTLIAGLPDLTVLVRLGGFTLEGTVSKTRYGETSITCHNSSQMFMAD